MTKIILASFLTLAVWMAVCGPALAGPRLVRIAAMGDIMLGTENLLPEDEAAEAFTDVKPYLKGRQVVLGNLEGPLTDRGAPTKVPREGVAYVFRTPPKYVERLREAGFTVMNLANNHLNDYGPAGGRQTREVLAEAGILATGAPGEVACQRVRHLTVAVIGLAPNQGCQDLNDIEAAAELVRREAAKPDTLVIVTFHGGGEGPGRVNVPHGPEFYLGERRGDLRRLGRALIDAGAHLVVGHGPHVPRGLEIYKDRLIAYSLGNFVTGRGLGVGGASGLAPLLLVDLKEDGRLAGGRVVGFRQRQAGRAAFDPDNEAAAVMHYLSLADFDRPALKADGQVVTSDREGVWLASAAAKPARPRILTASVSRPRSEARPAAPAAGAKAPVPKERRKPRRSDPPRISPQFAL